MCSFATPQASASTGQPSIIQDSSFLSSPTTSLPLARSLGARIVRVPISWYALAPDHGSSRKPHGNLSSPSAYPASAWAPFDALVRAARSDGLTVALQITGGPPRWAQSAPPRSYRSDPALFGYKPNAQLYGQFVHAVTERYDGRFRPSGASGTLPAVRFWSFWNEPNFGAYLGPQTTNGSTVPVSPTLYRSLLNAAWKAVHQTGHGHDTLLIGELDPLGQGLRKPGHPGPGPGGGTTAVIGATAFVRALYCVDTRYRPLTGTIARQWGCPSTTAASRRFRSSNPALFDATGLGAHPYSFMEAPNAKSSSINNNYVTFPVLDRLTGAVDQSMRAYRSSRHLPIYNDEFGYITRPPSGPGFPSPARAAIYLNQTEYLSYKNPRIATYDQYLIDDATPVAGKAAPGFNTGLYTFSGQPKATLYAFRLPLWLPKTTVRAGSQTEIWGGARPAPFAQGARTVAIQMQRNGRGSCGRRSGPSRVSTKTGYFDIHSKLPYSGNMRLAYTYPRSESLLPTSVAGTTIYGRTVTVKVTG